MTDPRVLRFAGVRYPFQTVVEKDSSKVRVAINSGANQAAPRSISCACIRGQRMLNGIEYFDSFPDEAPAPLESLGIPNEAICLTAELRAALEELRKYFEQFQTQTAEP